MVRDKYGALAIGATWGVESAWNRITGIVHDCYVEFGAPESEFEYSTRYEACKFKGTYER